jgi:hypothetical protein
VTTTAAPTAAAAPARAAILLPVFSLALFLNAALLFAVQPMFSKLALPLLGGAPAVWNTCMLVFQALLLAGYLYAHLTTRWLGARTQVAVHVGLLALSLLALPIGVPEGWTPPAGGAPIPWLVGLLLVGLGLPFFLLSAGAPLLQQWFSRTDHPAAANPYFLYAASNAGSMLALLAYPLLLEPTLGLARQRTLWALVYGGVVLLIAACAIAALRRPRAHPPGVPAGRTVDAAPALGDAPAMTTAERAGDAPPVPAAVRWRERAWWTLLAFVPSSLLLGVTTYLSTDVAAFPLLWVVPLALYLLTFVVVFARRRVIPHRVALWLQPLVLLPTIALQFSGRGGDLELMGPVHLLLFFVTALVCHGELARLRPGPERLTEFYLWMSVGGALGGAFNVLVAPVLFDRVLEYQLMLGLACALRPWPREELDGDVIRRDVLLPALLGAATYMLVKTSWVQALAQTTVTFPLLGDRVVNVILVVGSAAALVCFLFVNRPLRLAVGVLAVMMVAVQARAPRRAPLFADRSFFGVYGVRDLGNGLRVLYHGTTLHGAQDTRLEARRMPLTYYGVRGPLGDLFSVRRLAHDTLRVGVVGLGSGSVACYARPGDTFTFYEIDPLVERVARDSTLFTFLSDCTPDADVVLGDARISLARGAGPFDLLVVDAFSSDAIPVHLLTREALAVYERTLAPDGVIALHVSNRYLSLYSVVANLAADAGLVALLGAQGNLTAEDRARMLTQSAWIAIARDSVPLSMLSVRQPRWRGLAADSTERLWTDDYSNVLGAMGK